MKRTIAHALFGFFVVMACLGVLSRALDANATALVTVAKPEARVIAQSGEVGSEDGGEGRSEGSIPDTGESVDGNTGPIPGTGESVDGSEGQNADPSQDTGAEPAQIASESAEPVRYDCCVATSAVHTDAGGQSFVLVVETRAGFLGEELAVRRVNVRIETTDGAAVALTTGDLSSQQQVVVRASRELNDGDKVRLADV